ncbi:type VII secretion protein EsaA [Metabacillus sediminilitoris]|uniref:Type VII secretion protein EsaA n=1 Tax=Metabacillus sediminilitoris TaxID=2567941 RepID=A0A4S4BTK0_9BACI|nr:type VII secretion protein EsaA [Metabacillus sediminilitoris]QGQ48449.1 type VII secretion protein EsaA [Metabacillus sediminilitoris]THF77837.1 type VII secretion protein EsaA [Metabacillus sediminilitoris]
MNEKASSLVKLIVVILLIVITPLLFFRTIGDNPLKVVKRENATQSIAIINEDIGTQEDEEDIKFGQDVAAILTENSNFEWSVVGRSAGENGLRNLKYDAIVYLPSDFSENIMTYDDENPIKTNFQFKIQSQLNAVNKEKVLVEIEKATKRVNQKISSLYWNYVSADMENIRQEFDEILEKEVAFQETMTAFYKPSSKDLAGQIDEQKNMLTSLQSSIQQVDETAPEQKSTMEGYAQNLDTFVKYVEQYKEYQEKQQTILTEIQAQSIQSVNKATENQQPLFAASTNLFEENSNQLLESMTNLENSMMSSQQVFNKLEEQRYSQVARQISEYYDHQRKVLEFYQQLKDSTLLNDVEGQLASLSEKLSVGEEEPTEPTKPTEPSELPVESESSGVTEKPEQPPVLLSSAQAGSEQSQNDENNGGENQGQEGNGESTKPYVDLEKEQEELNSLSEEILKLKDQLSNMVNPTPEELQQVLGTLVTLNDRIVALKTALDEKEPGDNPLQTRVNELLDEIKGLNRDKDDLNTIIANKAKEIEDLVKERDSLLKEKNYYSDLSESLGKELNLYKDYESNIIKEIESKEQAILASSALSQTRKDLLTPIFSKEIKSKDLLDMMYYYSYLDRYESTLNSMLAENKELKAVLGDEYLQKEANKIVEITSDEQSGWEQLGKDMPTTQDALNTMEDGFTLFMAKYRQSVEEQQAALIENLEAIEQEATQVLNQINKPEQLLTVVEPTPAVDGEEVISGNERINEQMDSIHMWMDSVSESQSSIINFTGELQGRVNDVQADADQLNNKWSANVSSTELIRNDVFSVLGNTFVDGQSNGYVYDFLTNPLKISGDIPEETQSGNVQNIPPVVVLFIVLISSLLIGYASYYFAQPPLWIQATLFVLLNVIVGLIISLFGLEIYPLREESAVEWTVYTILLLAAGAALVRVAFTAHHLAGLFVTVGMVIFYVTPLLALTTPNFSFTDPMSEVYMSIQYGTESLFTQATIILVLIIAVLAALQFFISRKAATIAVEKGSETYEA